MKLLVAGAVVKLAEGILQEVDHLGSVRCVKHSWRLHLLYFYVFFNAYIYFCRYLKSVQRWRNSPFVDRVVK